MGSKLKGYPPDEFAVGCNIWDIATKTIVATFESYTKTAEFLGVGVATVRYAAINKSLIKRNNTGKSVCIRTFQP